MKTKHITVLEVLTLHAGFEVIENPPRDTWEGLVRLDGKIYGRAINRGGTNHEQAVRHLIPAAVKAIQDPTTPHGRDVDRLRELLRKADPDPLEKLLAAALVEMGDYYVVCPWLDGEHHFEGFQRALRLGERMGKGVRFPNGSRILFVSARGGTHEIAGMRPTGFALHGVPPFSNMVNELRARADRFDGKEFTR